MGPESNSPTDDHRSLQKFEEEKDQASNEFYIYPDKKTTMIFQFLYNPEYITVGNKIIINTDNFKAFGKITKLIPDKIDESIGTTKHEKADK